MQPNKIEAIYELREAAEKKGAAEAAVAAEGTARSRDVLLDAQLVLESKTRIAIDVCHECGHEHAQDQPHREPGRDNVIDVDFGRVDPGA